MNKILSIATCFSMSLFAGQAIAQDNKVPEYFTLNHTMSCTNDFANYEKIAVEKFNQKKILEASNPGAKFVFYVNIEDGSIAVFTINGVNNAACVIFTADNLDFGPFEETPKGTLN